MSKYTNNRIQNCLYDSLYPPLHKIRTVEINMKHRINLPLLLHQIYLHPPEKFLPDKEIVLQCRNKKTLAETARTAEEVYRTFLHQAVNQICLIDINKSVLYYTVKALYSYRIFHDGELIISECYCCHSQR